MSPSRRRRHDDLELYDRRRRKRRRAERGRKRRRVAIFATLALVLAGMERQRVAARRRTGDGC